MWRCSVLRQPVTVAKFINKSSLFILLLGVIRRLELKPISEQKVEHIFVAPPYCQTACCVQFYLVASHLIRFNTNCLLFSLGTFIPYLFPFLSNCAVRNADSANTTILPFP